ncbi:2',3'-cyclic-nucleotide 2'-phosphodiesterase family protein [Lactobacillus iners LactinV 03V1-b]|nr:2',3'-cyclic-nucleotide 2'-phosphodiesterase family protein [Lactobacillus iners LactinV 03V1-b]
MQNNYLSFVAIVIFSILISGVAGYCYRKHKWEQAAENAKNDAKHIIENARLDIQSAREKLLTEKQALQEMKKHVADLKKKNS